MPRGGDDPLDVTALGPIGTDFVEQQRTRAHDDGQQVVEIVCDAAGQMPDRFHPPRLLKLSLEIVPIARLFATRDVAGDAHQKARHPALVGDRELRGVHDAHAPRGAEDLLARYGDGFACGQDRTIR